MINPKTYDQIAGWAQDKYGAAAPSLMGATATSPSVLTGTAGGMLADTSSPSAPNAPRPDPTAEWWNRTSTAPQPSASPIGAPAASAPAAPAPSASTSAPSGSAPVNVGDWYRTTLGRDADQPGLAFWQGAVNSGGNAEQLYADFKQGAATNAERVNATDWSRANTYSGPRSTDGSTPVDDWGRNVLGRNLSPQEQAQWNDRFNEAGKASGAAGAMETYQEFLKQYSGQVKNPLDFAGASQINAGLPTPIAQINKTDLARRTIDPATETVRGQLNSLLDEDSPVLQQARADAMRTAADRGMLNSAMAASGGTDAMIRSALNIATPDAGFYNRASDYNVAAENQATMWNAEQQNSFRQAQMQMEMETTARGQQMTIAQMQDATSRYASDQTAANSRYNTDASYRQQADGNKKTLVNNIIANMELSPDRKAALLEQLGEGTSAKPGPNGAFIPGTGLAGAVYVIDSITSDLAYYGGRSTSYPEGIAGGAPSGADPASSGSTPPGDAPLIPADGGWGG